MRLKRLELFGFKSFADRTLMDFAKPVVGIVGPNGCGKSNVVDAVRWVLGEQRPTSMRGGEMTDVIFKGSASRPALGVAEVTLVLDNDSGVIEGKGTEVSLTRRVFKSGEGEYLIDGDRVRLKDVREMLFGTGLGSRGYSVLEQGKIDAVLSANPVERRAIFEEAAGVSRYRQRKKETESRLSRVEADVLRLEDIVRELERRERSLKIQAGRAQRYVESRAAWLSDGTRWARHQVRAQEGEIAASRGALEEGEARAEALRARRRAAEEDTQTREREQHALASEVERLGEQASELAGELRALDERRSQLDARVRSWREESADERRRASELEAKLAERREELRALAAQVEELERGRAVADERLRDVAARHAGFRGELSELRQLADHKNEAVLAVLSERTSCKNRVQHLEHAIEPLLERAARTEERRREAEASVAAARESEGRAVAELARRDAELERLGRERAALERESELWSERAEGLAQRRAELELEVARLASRVESLLDWEREREGLEAGARQLLAAIESDEGPRLSGALRGLFADHVITETLYARALDGALGERAQALVVDEAADAEVVLAWLKEVRGGRARLAIAGGPAGAEAPAPASEDGVEGRLIDFVRVDAGYESLAAFLLGDVFLVRDAARARALVEAWPWLTFVTLEGDVVDAAGVVGGHMELAQGPIGRRSTAAELSGQRGRIEEELERVRRELDDVHRAVGERGAALSRLRAAIEEQSAARAQVHSAAASARARLSDLERSRELYEHECAGLMAERERVESDLAAARERHVVLEASQREAADELAALEARRADLEREIEGLAADESQARVELTSVSGRLEANGVRLRDLRELAADTERELARSAGLADQHAQSAAAGERESTSLAEARTELLARRGELDARLLEMRARERDGRTVIEGLRQRVEALNRELEGLFAEVSEARLEHQRKELALDEVRRRAMEDFGLAAEALAEAFEPDPELADPEALAELARRVVALKAELDKLGPVNVEAVDELREVSERLGFLQSQRQDLAEARRALEGTLRKLNAESERRFLETFEEVREHFRAIFRQLFGGGKADVTLAPGEPVLEAGIEITARPPGRESLPISLLSGGQRTLTALAILFAVFRAQPSPFCILDEVDAALDDANINRFLLLLSHSLGGTQFVVVTHNKGTMAACDMLYGVTMAVRGVSHVVGVELAEVDDFVPAAKPQGARSEAGRESARKGTRSGAEGAEEETIVELVPKQGVLGHVVRDPAPELADETEEGLRPRRSRGR